MPSWREYLQKSEFALKNSKYFKGLNDLLNNEELIGYAKNRGYKIIFNVIVKIKLHLDFLKLYKLSSPHPTD